MTMPDATGARRRTATAITILTLLVGFAAAPAPACAAFRYRPAEPEPARSDRAPAPAKPVAAPVSCGYSSADLLAAPAPGATAAGGSRYWLRCGEPLAVALARWGLPDGVLVLAPAGQPLWRAATDYRFAASDFGGALARLERSFARSKRRPLLRYDRANRILTVTAPETP